MALHTARRRTVAATLLASIASCSDSTGLSSGTGAARDELSGLEHVVTLTPAQPAAGGDVEIRSVITNRGTASVALSSRICGLDYEGSVELAYPNGSANCAGFSTTGPIAPGESRGGTDFNRITSSRGVYTLRVRHALRPELWVELRVVVR